MGVEKERKSTNKVGRVLLWCRLCCAK